MKPETRLFDAEGNSLPPGDYPIGVFDLRHWHCCHLIAQAAAGHEPDAILLMPLVALQSIPAPILGAVVGMLDNGQTIAVHARDGDAMTVAWQVILPLLGAAGHA
jgi:hypothetical protein